MFAKGFDKIAVSAGWTAQRVAGGLARRANMAGKEIKSVANRMAEKTKYAPVAMKRVGKTEHLSVLNAATKHNPEHAKAELGRVGSGSFMRENFKKVAAKIGNPKWEKMVREKLKEMVPAHKMKAASNEARRGGMVSALYLTKKMKELRRK